MASLGLLHQLVNEEMEAVQVWERRTIKKLSVQVLLQTLKIRPRDPAQLQGWGVWELCQGSALWLWLHGCLGLGCRPHLPLAAASTGVTGDFWDAGGSCWVTWGPLAAAQMDSWGGPWEWWWLQHFAGGILQDFGLLWDFRWNIFLLCGQVSQVALILFCLRKDIW